MKKSLRFGSLLLPALFLASCGEGASSNITMFHSKYDNGKYFEEISRSETDDTKVYMTAIAVSNHESSAVTFKTSDFKMTIDKKDYTPVCFVKERKFAGASSTIGGSFEVYYISKETKEETIPVTEAEMSNLVLAFETYSEQSFKLTYKGNEIQNISR